MDIETTTDAATAAIEEYPTTTKTVLITVAATAVTLIGAKLVLSRHFKKATEAPVVHVVTDLPATAPSETVNA